MVDPCTGAGASDTIFAKVMNFIDADRVAYGAHLARRGLEGVAAPEARRFISGFVICGEVIHRFHAIGTTKDCALRLPNVIDGCGVQWTTDRQFFIRVAD